jgi:hypothetical protein
MQETEGSVRRKKRRQDLGNFGTNSFRVLDDFWNSSYNSLFTAHTCSALGPNALLMLQQMFPAETVSAAVDGPIWQEYLQRVMAKLRLELRPFAVKLLGLENADYLLSWEHPCVSLYSTTLVEHLLCECRKTFQAENRAHKKQKTGTSDDEYMILWKAAWDAFLCPGSGCQGSAPQS